MLQVVMSCPPGFLVWNLVNPDGVSFLQFLSIFMILGIGADDVFVLLDAWKQARLATEGKGDPDQVFAMAYRRAFSAMLTTTTTTGAAFCFGAFSPIPLVSHFCLFAAIVVIFDFIWCITFFASSLRVFERFFMGRSCCCGGASRPAGRCGGPGCCWGGLRVVHSSTPCGAAAATTGSDAGAAERTTEVDERALERFCSGPLFTWVRRWKLAVLLCWLAVAAAAATTAGLLLKTATKQPEIGDEDNDLVRVGTVMREYFSTQEQSVVTVSWGLPKEQAVTEFTSTNPITPVVASLEDRAEVLTTPEGQQAMLRLCRSADEDGVRCEGDTCLVYGSGRQCTRNPNVWTSRSVWLPNDPYCTTGRYCFMEWVEEYALHHSNGTLSFPVRQQDFVPLLQSPGFAAYLEAREAANREAQRHWDGQLEQEKTGWILQDGRLKFAWMTFNASFKAQGHVEELNQWHERWGAHVLERAPATEARQSSEMYVFMVLQNELLAAAIQGILVCLVVTAVILALVTFNWRLALIGLLNICIITVTFLGIMPLIPWELGSSECIFLIAVVGLSVDYTVHLLHAYNEQGGSREERMQGALSTMGISVASGAITTMGAGMVLFFCDIAFFQQYGSFIFLVILISVLAALTNLPAMLLLAGPDGDEGRIALLYLLKQKLMPRVDHVAEATEVAKANPTVLGK